MELITTGFNALAAEEKFLSAFRARNQQQSTSSSSREDGEGCSLEFRKSVWRMFLAEIHFQLLSERCFDLTWTDAAVQKLSRFADRYEHLVLGAIVAGMVWAFQGLMKLLLGLVAGGEWLEGILFEGEDD